MKRWILLSAFGVLASAGMLFAQDFRHSRWGDTMEEVRAIEGAPKLTLGDGTMIYNKENGGIFFSFVAIRRTTSTTWRLVEGMQNWGSNGDGRTLADHLEIWKRNMATLVKQYGEPSYFKAPSGAESGIAIWILEERSIARYSLNTTLSHLLMAVPLESRKGEAMYATYLAMKQQQ